MESPVFLVHGASCLFIFLISLFSLVVAAKDDSEVQSLLAFRGSIIEDPVNALSNWDSRSANPCNWTGIVCSSGDEGHVVKMELQNYGLRGKIPMQIGNLSELQVLNLTKNQLSGSIPASLGRLSSLAILDLSGNLLQGPIPRAVCANCSKLLSLNFGKNILYGTIPSTLLSCRYLQELYLRNNHLSGTIPIELGDSLVKLQVLDLGSNSLAGSIPASLGKLSSLTYLRLSHNLLQGSVPTALGNCSKLSFLNLGVNSLRGTFPSTLLNCTDLEQLYLDSNDISSRIPPEIGRIFSRLQQLNLEGNNLVGSIPKSLCNATLLKRVLLSANQLTGTIPLCFSRLSELKNLRLRNNHLVSGISSPDEPVPILQSLSNISTLMELRLGGNKLYGILPSELGLFHPKLRTLSLGSNFIGGSIPKSLGNLSSLTELNLRINLLTGTIPATLVSLSSMMILNLQHNRLHGDIPLFNGTNLKLLHLSHNLLTGNIPVELGNSWDLSEVDFSHNSLVGNIKSQFISTNLNYLNLSFNNLTGVLPRFISASMEILDLRSNKLTGALPPWILTIPQLNLSYNDFEGSMDCSLNKNILLGNSKIQYNCFQQPSHPSSAHPINKIVTLACIIGSVVLVIIIYLTVTILFAKKSKEQAPENVLLSEDASSFMLVGERELIQATNNFHPSNFLGRGRYGDAYKGILANGMTVAIKLFSADTGAEEEMARECFITECRTLGQIRHKNLVKIITVCCSENFNALILEFMPNGTLDDLLHRPRNDGRLMPLSLKTRIRLLREVAIALAYLHHDCNPPIIHCDLKPQNVLLDEDMSAKVADFDIACMLGRSDMTATLRLQGSIGYIAPEYGVGAQAQISGDVYSFGVLILEVLTRVRPTDTILGSDFTLPKWIATALARGRTYCKEVMIKNRYGQRELEILCDEEFSIFEGMLKLGLWCSSEWPAQRPTMREVEKLIEGPSVDKFSRFESNVDEILHSIACNIQTSNATSEFTSSSTSL